jgi:hypothetical protein
MSFIVHGVKCDICLRRYELPNGSDAAHKRATTKFGWKHTSGGQHACSTCCAVVKKVVDIPLIRWTDNPRKEYQYDE